ncbi:MAG: radical SAM protein [Lachnospiraceae bacterium]|nr:radical SAM protein [Lachnospiraceae bacterium]
MFLNLNRFLSCTAAEGPGKRFCLWTQGCAKRCPGCCNSPMQTFEPRLILSVSEICEQILQAINENGIVGVTFLGGEPLLQARGLAEVARFARDHGLSVMVFTGFTRSECRENPLPGIPELLRFTDVLVDGPYLCDQPDELRNWVGSTNQTFHYFTDRYTPAIETDPEYASLVEIRPVSADATIFTLNGCPKTLGPIEE